ASDQDYDHLPWTWLYKKTFTQQELREADKHTGITLEKTGIQLFTQLVVSWNALRPEQGYFSFWVQAHDHENNSWSPWHKMMEWGADVQRSYLSNTSRGPSYLHVRLETGNGHFSDGFRIKIIAHDGAHLHKLQRIFVALSDFTKFQPEEIARLALASVFIKNVPQKAQL